MEELVSIVLPVYNGERFLKQSIDSILCQTYQNWELLVLDDCSTDHTAEIVRAYMQQDARIQYHKNEVNLRLPRNLNRGFSLAKGDYLTWTSDDNKYLPEAIEKMYRALKEKPEAQFVYASCRVIDEADQHVEYIMVDSGSTKRLIGKNGVGACFMYTRKAYEAVGEYDPEYTLVEDFDYWQRIAARFDVATIKEILYEYRWHDGSLTSTLKKETFNKTLEKMLLKNRPAFGRIGWEQAYYYYSGLHSCRENLGDEKNPYALPYKLYNMLYLVLRRIPGKIRRMIK